VVDGLFSETTGLSVESGLGADSSELRNALVLSKKLMHAGLYEESYAHASRAVTLSPTNPYAWLLKGLGAISVSTPPEFRLNELKTSLTESLRIEELKEFRGLIVEHLLAASSRYRSAIRQHCKDADAAAQKEPLAAGVDVGLQLSMRNKRVADSLTATHRKGYYDSINVVILAASISDSASTYKLILRSLDEVLATSTYPAFVSFLDNDGGRDQVLRLRQIAVEKLHILEPEFAPPAPPAKPGCFIATAACGEEYHPKLRLLRRFRDEVLLKSILGASFVTGYYRVSPKLAAILVHSEILKRLCYLFLIVPMAVIVRFHFFLAVEHRTMENDSVG
jgi:hypothetical protein